MTSNNQIVLLLLFISYRNHLPQLTAVLDDNKINIFFLYDVIPQTIGILLHFSFYYLGIKYLLRYKVKNKNMFTLYIFI